MRVVFMGTPDFAVSSLQAVVEAGHEVVLVVSRPDKPSGRGQKLHPPPVVVRARELGLDVAQPRALRKGPFPVRYASLGADVAVVVAYGRILPAAMLEAPRHGCINVHASLLPRWRGAGPIQAAILAGDTSTGVCTQQMAEEMDTGPVYLSRTVAIGPRETAGSLHDRLVGLGAEVLVETLDRLLELTPIEQDHDAATYCGKVNRDSGLVDLGGDAEAIDRQVRAMTPWPGGWIPWSDGPLKMLEVAPAPGEGPPGTVLSASPLVVACGRGALELVRVQAPGRRSVSGREFANGARLGPGNLLQSPEES
jgi:methionyl-tRNA formyltransferase